MKFIHTIIFLKNHAEFKAIILSGSPNSVRGENVLHPDLSGIRGKKPMLAVCYGAQYLAHILEERYCLQILENMVEQIYHL